MNLLLVLLASVSAAGGTAASGTVTDFGPVRAEFDLRTMLTDYVVRKSCDALKSTATRRRDAFRSGEWEAWRDNVRGAVRQGLGPMPFGADGGPFNVRVVSKQERPGYVLENVLFESLPGLDVRSVYLPLAKDFPPPWPAIVVPVGHSAKTTPNYQLPAQVFARRGMSLLRSTHPTWPGRNRRQRPFSRRCTLLPDGPIVESVLRHRRVALYRLSRFTR